MSHINDKTLYDLTRRAMRGEQATPQDEEYLDHIRSCEYCYRRYAVLAQLFDLVGTGEPSPVLATVELHLDRTGEGLRAAFRRVEDAAARIGFFIPAAPVPAGARGAAGPDPVVRVDGTETEEDMIAYDTRRHTLTVQLSLQQHPGLQARAEVYTRDGGCLVLPLREEDGVLYGTLENFQEPEAEIRLVEYH